MKIILIADSGEPSLQQLSLESWREVQDTLANCQARLALIEGEADPGSLEQLRRACPHIEQVHLLLPQQPPQRHLRKEAQARLQEFEKMKDMFLALVSHELRTPLTTIKSSSHILSRLLGEALPGSKEEKLVSVTQSLSVASARMEALVQELLSYHTIRNGVQPFELKSVDLAALVTSVTRELESLAAKKNISLQLRRDPQLPSLQGDPPRLREAIHHLIKNAIHYNVEGGRVDISLHSNPEGEGGLRLSITDTGVGIPHHQSEQVFLPFFQAQDVLTRRVEGVGLGLAITRHIIESHSGRISLVGELGQGTQVQVWLPLTPPEIAASEFVPRPPSELDASDPQGLLDYLSDLHQALEGERGRRRLLEDQYRAMESTFLETLSALMRQIDLRGAHNPAHGERVRLFASEIARRIDPTLPENRDFQLSLLLHDIGKIGVAESLLQKMGSLNASEVQQVQAHVAIGAEILSNIHFLQPALQTVRHHHERWDGKGYPDGLLGAQIPLWARIISVADSFDAMTQDRPYRKALEPEQAKAEIERNAGSQYDPVIVEAFCQGWNSILALARHTEDYTEVHGGPSRQNFGEVV